MNQDAVHQKIQNWYHTHGRQDLPWRHTDDPYHIYLSEVMLQQTQVNTVLKRFYHPFLETFPSLQSVAQAPLSAVLKRWEGLGYYSRAKYLHRTAQLTKGQLPETIADLQALPGIGKNTAHALATFAFGQAVPIMEANVKRVLCRMHKISQPKADHLWDLAYKQLDTVRSFDYNQAMMDIGALVCTARAPHCNQCPLVASCRGKDSPESYPQKTKRQVPVRQQTVVVRQYQNSVQLHLREGQFLHGLWGFATAEKIPKKARYLGQVQHQYTHFKTKLAVYVLKGAKLRSGEYYDRAAISRLAISKVDEKILQLLTELAICQDNVAK